MKPDSKSKVTPKLNSRRVFLGSLAGLSLVLSKELHGKQNIALSSLWSMKPEKFNEIKPIFRKECKILVKNNIIYATFKGQSEIVPIMEYNELIGETYRSFNGRTKISEIVNTVKQSSGLEYDEAYKFVRQVFLYLVEGEVCVPNPRSE